MRISIITVCYNRVETIERTIRSVIGQDYEEKEYIIIDGGSSDGTVDIIRRYEGELACWVSEKDGGIYEAMNKGIRYATGEVIAFLNSDDWYEDNILAETAHGFEDAKTQILCGDVRCHHDGAVSRYRVNREPEEELRFRMVYWQPAMFVRRELFERYGGFDTRYRIAADYDWMLRMYDRHIAISLTDRVLTNFSYGGISTRADMLRVQAEEGRQAALLALSRNQELSAEQKEQWKKRIENEYDRGIENYKFKKLLREIAGGDGQMILARVRSAFRNDACEIFGCGMIFREIGGLLRRLQISVAALWDNDPGKWGQRIDGIQIRNPAQLKPGQNTVIIASVDYERQIGLLLEQKGFKKGEDYLPYSELRRRILRAAEEKGIDQGDVCHK